MNKWLRDNAASIGTAVTVAISAGGMVWFISGEITAARHENRAMADALEGVQGILHQTNLKLDAMASGVNEDQQTIFHLLAASSERNSVIEATIRALEREISRMWAQLERMGFTR